MKKSKNNTKGKTLIKCKREKCSKLFNQKENNEFHKKQMKYTPTILKKIQGYCDVSCMDLHKADQEKTKALNAQRYNDQYEAGKRLIQKSYDIYWTSTTIIYNKGPKIGSKLINELESVLAKYKK